MNDKYKDSSKKRLDSLGSKKIRTTMIGALSLFEEYFGYLWGQHKKSELTEEEIKFEELFNDLRTELLDLGNAQIRNFQKELEQYTVEWNRYTLKLPVIPGMLREEEDE